jgi:hypothetical protein
MVSKKVSPAGRRSWPKKRDQLEESGRLLAPVCKGILKEVPSHLTIHFLALRDDCRDDARGARLYDTLGNVFQTSNVFCLPIRTVAFEQGKIVTVPPIDLCRPAISSGPRIIFARLPPHLYIDETRS